MTKPYHLMWRKAAASRKEIRVLQKAMLCEVLSVSVLPPVSYGTHGKPFIPSMPDFHYNFSDSGDFVMLGWTWGEIGVDLQKIVPTHYDLERMAKRFYTQEEYSLLHSLSDPVQKEQAFFRLWAIKEAYLKCLGIGLAGGMNKYQICPEFPGSFKDPGILTRGVIVSSQAAFPRARYEEIQPPQEGYTAAVVTNIIETRHNGSKHDGPKDHVRIPSGSFPLSS